MKRQHYDIEMLVDLVSTRMHPWRYTHAPMSIEAPPPPPPSQKKKSRLCGLQHPKKGENKTKQKKQNKTEDVRYSRTSTWPFAPILVGICIPLFAFAALNGFNILWEDLCFWCRLSQLNTDIFQKMYCQQINFQSRSILFLFVSLTDPGQVALECNFF